MASLRWLLVLSLSTAACTAANSEPSPPAPHDDAGDAEQAPIDAAPDAGHEEAEAATLPELPIPDGGYPACGAKEIAEAGPCCENLYCYTPTSGACSTDLHAIFDSLGVTIGSCMCGTSAGPYAAPADSDAGSCCYVIGAQFCQ